MRPISFGRLTACVLALSVLCTEMETSAADEDMSQVSDVLASSDFRDAVDPVLSAWEAKGGSGVVLVVSGDCVSGGAKTTDQSIRNCSRFGQPLGQADREDGREMTLSTPFDIGSLTKEFTAYAILKLHEEGILSLDQTIADFFPNAPADKKPITLRQILKHTSGLADIVDADLKTVSYQPDIDFVALSKDELVRRVLNASLVSEPGLETNYSNFGYSLLAAVIETATGRSYGDYVAESVFGPFGLSVTGYPPRLVFDTNTLAVGYQQNKRWGTTYQKMLPDGPSWMLIGTGGMIAPIDDVYRWLSGIATAARSGDSAAEQFIALFSETTGSGERYIASFGSNDVFEAGYLWMMDRDILILAFTNDSERRASTLINALWAAIRECACIPSAQ